MKTAMLVLTAALAFAARADAQSVATEPLPPVTLPPAIARVLTAYETAWRARDAAALARLFADDRASYPTRARQ